jgi:hypothetical protein
MKVYRYVGLALILLLGVTITRKAQLGAKPSEAQNRRAAPSPGTQPAQSQAAPGQNAQQGPAGPASDLLKQLGVNQADYGIKVVQTFDASGKPAYETKGGDLLFFTNASVSYNSTADKPMIIVINARTRKIIALADIDVPTSPHGITLSPDAKWIYLPSGFASTGGRRLSGGAPTAIIDAKTLKLAAILNTGRRSLRDVRFIRRAGANFSARS